MKRRAFAWLILIAALAGCEPPFAGCEPPMDLTDDSVPLDGGQDAGGTCTLVMRTPGWHGPYYVWKGQNDGRAPACPGMPITAEKEWDLYADLVPPPVCAPCACAPSTGTCQLSSKLTAHDVSCQDVGQSHKDFSFDAPPAWDGSCDPSVTIPEGVAKSVTIDPIKLTQESCAPLDSVLEPPASLDARTVPPSAWQTLARVCGGWNWIPKENPDSWCIPDDLPRPEGFKLCIMHEGEQPECASDWPDVYVVYADADDDRECTECRCGPPVGGMCTAMVSLDKDPACTAPVKQGMGIDSAMSTCVDINPPGQLLMSKFVTSLSYIPGTCEPGRIEVKGTITKIGAITFCCQP